MKTKEEISDYLQLTAKGRQLMLRITMLIANHFQTQPEKIPIELITDLAVSMDEYTKEYHVAEMEKVKKSEKLYITAPIGFCDCVIQSKGAAGDYCYSCHKFIYKPV